MTEHQKHWFQCLIFSIFSISLISSLAKGRRKKTSFCHWKKPDRQRLIVPLAFEIEPASASFAISHQIPSRNAAGLKCKTHMTTGVPRKVVVWVFDAAVRPDAAYNQSWSSSSCESLEVPVTSPMVQYDGTELLSCVRAFSCVRTKWLPTLVKCSWKGMKEPCQCFCQIVTLTSQAWRASPG